MTDSHRSRWLRTGLLLTALVGLAGVLWVSGRAKPESGPAGLGPSFQYDLTDLQRTPTDGVQFVEQAPIALSVRAPRGLAVGPLDRIYVGGEHAVSVYDSNGAQASTFPVSGAVQCLFVDGEGTAWVGLRDHVELHGSDGRTLAEWESLGTNAVLTAIGVTSNDVFVADAGNRIILRFDHAGRLLGRIGGKDPARDIAGFVIPSACFDLALLPDGSLWAVDPGRHKLIHFTAAGDILSSWAKPGMTIDGFCGCCNPTHIALRPDGSFVTSEKGLPRVKVVGPVGNLVGVVAGPAAFAEGTEGLDLAVDSQGRILVLDPPAAKVRIFTEKQD